MGRIIDTKSVGKDRAKLCKLVVVSIRELMKQSTPDQNSKDLAAFIVLALKEIHAGIDPSVEAWEKRGYWLKADRFRMEWMWTESFSREMKTALLAEDWGGVAQAAIKIAEKLKAIKIPVRNSGGQFWKNSLEHMLAQR